MEQRALGPSLRRGDCAEGLGVPSENAGGDSDRALHAYCKFRGHFPNVFCYPILRGGHTPERRHDRDLGAGYSGTGNTDVT